MSHICGKQCGCSEHPMKAMIGTGVVSLAVSNETILTTTESLAVITENGTGPETGAAQSQKQDASTPNWFAKYGGFFFALAASIFFSLTFLDVKVLQKRGFSPFGTAMLFNLGVILPAGTIIALHDFGLSCRGICAKRKRILSEIWPLSDQNKRSVFKILVLQGMLQAASVVFRSYSLQYLDVGDMTVIVFSSPILTTIIAHFMVNEPCGVIFIFIALYTFCGVVLMTKPPLLTGGKEFDSQHLIGIGLACCALISLSLKFVVTRKIQNANIFLMTIFLGASGFLVSLPLCLIFEEWTAIVPKDTSECLLLAGLFGAFCSIASINKALTMENAGPVALVRSLDVLFAFLLQFIFLNIVPDLLSTGGAIIVVSGVLAVGFRKWLLTTNFETARRVRSVLYREFPPKKWINKLQFKGDRDFRPNVQLHK